MAKNKQNNERRNIWGFIPHEEGAALAISRDGGETFDEVAIFKNSSSVGRFSSWLNAREQEDAEQWQK